MWNIGIVGPTTIMMMDLPNTCAERFAHMVVYHLTILWGTDTIMFPGRNYAPLIALHMAMGRTDSLLRPELMMED